MGNPSTAESVADATTTSSEKPVVIPDLPEPDDKDFDEDIGEEERNHYKNKYKDVSKLHAERLHCTACDRHLGCAPYGDSKMRQHPMLRTLVCRPCFNFYNSGEFDRGEDGSELYCRWCGQGGEVFCCSDCPVVFCSACIKRNFGEGMIKEIEDKDDWKCFKCTAGPALWDLRATCWALIRYCGFMNKLAYTTTDPDQKAAIGKICSLDDSTCCPKKKRTSTAPPREKAEKRDIKKEKEKEIKNAKDAIITKLPPSIQVKKFASIVTPSKDKKPVKRAASPIKIKNPCIVKNPIQIAPYQKILPPANKRPRLLTPVQPGMSPIPVGRPKVYTPRMVRPRAPHVQTSQPFNGYGQPAQNFNNQALFNPHSPFNNNTPFNINFDNINLSLENLTQGLDMAAMAGMSSEPDENSDVVCTPDFPLEPLCEVTEENNDDDVECITPGPVAAPKPPPPLAVRGKNLPDFSPDNVVQMTENDVTVNALTGGLKFRVDPRTLSSNKMYRLPDGRIFAINSNPNMPGGYSATVVAFSENPIKSTAPRSLNTPKNAPSTSPRILNRELAPKTPSRKAASNNNKAAKPKTSKSDIREMDMRSPVEWYRYNLLDAIDALEYSLSRLKKLKAEATTQLLRTRKTDEMKQMHRALDRTLNTSSTRFLEVKENLNKGFKEYLISKSNGRATTSAVSDEDDDVEILNPDPPKVNLDDSDDAIFIDENSMESAVGSVHGTLSATATEATAPIEHPDSQENADTHENVPEKDKNESGGERSGRNSGIDDEDPLRENTEKLDNNVEEIVPDKPDSINSSTEPQPIRETPEEINSSVEEMEVDGAEKVNSESDANAENTNEVKSNAENTNEDEANAENTNDVEANAENTNEVEANADNTNEVKASKDRDSDECTKKVESNLESDNDNEDETKQSKNSDVADDKSEEPDSTELIRLSDLESDKSLNDSNRENNGVVDSQSKSDKSDTEVLENNAISTSDIPNGDTKDVKLENDLQMSEEQIDKLLEDGGGDDGINEDAQENLNKLEEELNHLTDSVFEAMDEPVSVPSFD